MQSQELSWYSTDRIEIRFFFLLGWKVYAVIAVAAAALFLERF